MTKSPLSSVFPRKRVFSKKTSAPATGFLLNLSITFPSIASNDSFVSAMVLPEAKQKSKARRNEVFIFI